MTAAFGKSLLPKPWPDGWLYAVPELHERRAPGNTCLSALRGDRGGTIEEPLNDSKGCGGVMRAAPAGLFEDIDDPFAIGAETAAITHGHPTGYLTAGFLAELIAQLRAGTSLELAHHRARLRLQREEGAAETLAALDRAEALIGQGSPTPERVESLGQGWVADEALAIAVYCAFETDSVHDAILLAANHSGDSDSTAAIAGNISGTLYGRDALPAHWLEHLELLDTIELVAADIVRHNQPYRSTGDYSVEIPDWDRYPGW